MSLKIVRNDITKMNTEAIVNTAGTTLSVGDGCDRAVYQAAGFEKLIDYRAKNIGEVEEGEVFITPGFGLEAKYIIHAVSPLYIDGESGEEPKLRACYRKSLQLAADQGIHSISFPLISTGSFGYPMADGLRIAVDEINSFLLENDIDVTLVVFGNGATSLAEKIYPSLEEYIDHNYVRAKREEEYGGVHSGTEMRAERLRTEIFVGDGAPAGKPSGGSKERRGLFSGISSRFRREIKADSISEEADFEDYDEEFFESELEERTKHIADPFGVYLLYLLETRKMRPVDVQNRGWISKHIFTKINKNPQGYQPGKETAFQLCVGLELNLDESKDFIARAGFVFSPSKLDDVIWKFGIENHLDIFDISDLLEKYGFPSVVGF